MTTSTLEVRPPAPPVARWETPPDLGNLRGDALVDTLWAVAVGSVEALDEHRAAAAERSRHALVDGLLAGARQKLRAAEADILDAFHDPSATAGTFERAYAARREAAEAVESLKWRPHTSYVKKPAGDALAAGIASRTSVRNWWALVAAEHRLFSEEQLRAGCARAAALMRPALETAQAAGALLARVDDTGSQQRRDNARESVRYVEQSIALARAHAGLQNHNTNGAQI